MNNLVFNITERNEKGSKVRRTGQIPCVLYGEHLEKPISAKMTRKEMSRILSTSNNSVLSLKLNDKLEKCVLKDIQRDTFGTVIHLDFQKVTKGEAIKLRVPIRFLNQEALESRRLLLETNISELQLQGDVGKFPESIEIDVSKLEYGDQILLKDLNIPKELKCDINDDVVIADIGAALASQEVEKDEEVLA